MNTENLYVFGYIFAAIFIMIGIYMHHKNSRHHNVPEKVELKHILEMIMTIKDDLNSIIASQTEIKVAIAAISVGTGADLTPVLTAVAGVDTKVSAIQAELVATPAP